MTGPLVDAWSALSQRGVPASVSPVNLRRILAAGTVGLVAIAVLSACGFDYPTDRISNLTVGTNYRDGNVSVLNAVVVSTAGNGGTLIATLVNNTDQPQQLTGITGTGKVTAVSGTFAVGDVLDLTFAFGDGTTALLEVPVVADVGEWAGLDTATPSASPSASAGS
jgi:hypothetical protein